MDFKSINWDLCVLCQANETCVVTPLESGYKTLADNWQKWQDEIGNFPFDVSLATLPDGSDLLQVLRQNNARWHRDCERKINSKNITRCLDRKRKVPVGSENKDESNKRRTFRDNASTHIFPNSCFLCKHSKKEKLRSVSTMNLDTKIKECAQCINDFDLLAKIGTSDLIALEAKYHCSCLTVLFRKKETSNQVGPNPNKECEGTVFAELVDYIEDTLLEKPDNVFRLIDLVKLYCERLHQLNIKDIDVNSTRLKERLLIHVPHLVANKEAKHVYITSDKTVGSMLKDNYETDFDELSLHMSKVVKTIRRNAFDLEPDSNDYMKQDYPVPHSLQSLVSMLLYGTNITEQVLSVAISPAVTTIAQLIIFNMQKRPRVNLKQDLVRKQYHHKRREPSIPVYISLKLHALTRKKQLVDCLFNMGVCVSYSRTQDIVTGLANRVCEVYNRESVVCPPQLQKGLFTLGAIDNIDHNPTSTTARGSFHGTSLSLFQNIFNESFTDFSSDTDDETADMTHQKRSTQHLPLY